MGYKSAQQVLKQAEELKNKVSAKCDLLNDLDAWTDQQRLQMIYHQVLVQDLEYALDKKVEQDLWNIGFKNHISILQELVRDKKNPKRSDCQALLTWCLEAASGFYINLLQELCNAFDLDFPFRKRGTFYGQTSDINCSEPVERPQTSSCLYICQYCLVHLGDIARYRNQRKQAENFYKQAIQVSPTSGHPYNQLALLEASRGDKLATVFYYVRGIAVKNPFPASITNLSSTLNAVLDKESYLHKIQAKMTSSEFIQLYLCAQSRLHSTSDLDQAGVGVRSLTTAMTALVATQSFTAERLLAIAAVNLYTWKHVTGEMSGDQLTKDEEKVSELVLDLLAGSISAMLVPVHTLKMEESLMDYYALPAVKILMYWIKSEPEVLSKPAFTSRLQIWPSLCKLLNNVQKYMKDFDYNKYTKLPLTEDKNLLGFLPLLKSFKTLDFKMECVNFKIERVVRMKRILEFGTWLTELDVNEQKLITKCEKDDEILFEPSYVPPDPTNDLLEEIKSFSIGQTIEIKNKSPEKRSGILKPQGSLEKSREEREQMSCTELNIEINNATVGINNNKTEVAKMKRLKQNVALQSIFKKMEENKQVKFSVEEVSKDKDSKSVKFDAKSITKSPSPAAAQFTNSPPLRTQSFNQNHPAFPVPNNKPDFLNNLRNISNNSSMDTPPNIPSFYQAPNTSIFAPVQSNGFSTSQPPFTPPFNPSQPPPPLPNVYPPSSRQFNVWKQEDMGPSWWQSTPAIIPPVNTSVPPPNQMPQQPNITVPPPNRMGDNNSHMTSSSQNFSGNNYMYPNVRNNMSPYGDFSKINAGGEIFPSPWTGFNRTGYANEGFDNSNRGMSMRQAMLKEGNTVTDGSSSTLRHSNPQNDKFQFNTSAYSLFNANSWTPNLAGQLRGSNAGDKGTQAQSLFMSPQGPQSLAQLLEQQNQMHKGDS